MNSPFPEQGKMYQTEYHAAVWRVEFSKGQPSDYLNSQNYAYKSCVSIAFKEPYLFVSVEPCDQRPDKFNLVKLLTPAGKLLEGRMELFSKNHWTPV